MSLTSSAICGLNDIDYQDTIFPEGLEKVPPKFAISARNKWMVSRTDILVTYVNGKIGGAAKFKEMAERKGKYVINLPDLIPDDKYSLS